MISKLPGKVITFRSNPAADTVAWSAGEQSPVRRRPQDVAQGETIYSRSTVEYVSNKIGNTSSSSTSSATQVSADAAGAPRRDRAVSFAPLPTVYHDDPQPCVPRPAPPPSQSPPRPVPAATAPVAPPSVPMHPHLVLAATPQCTASSHSFPFPSTCTCSSASASAANVHAPRYVHHVLLQAKQVDIRACRKYNTS